VPDLVSLLLKIVGRFLPGEVLLMVKDNLRDMVSEHKGGLLSFGVFLSLWTGSNAVISVIKPLNNAFKTEERRTYWKVRGITVLLVIGFSFFVIVSLLLLIFGNYIGMWIASLAGLGTHFTIAWKILRWPLIFCLMATALSALYRYAPALKLEWRKIFPGAVTATGAWVAVSTAFSFYVNNFGSYNKTYGSIGAVIALLSWMYTSGFVILLGGEIIACMSDQACEKTALPDIKGVIEMRKTIVSQEPRDTVAAELEWLDLPRLARAELTSEDHSYPLESALEPVDGPGWRASEPGRQEIRFAFDEPIRIRRIHLVFQEDKQQRTQEFVLRWSPDDDGRPFREIVRQQFNFAPPDSSREEEDYTVDLAGVKSLELIIIADISGGEARASLLRLRLA
jgi:membrane protein